MGNRTHGRTHTHRQTRTHSNAHTRSTQTHTHTRTQTHTHVRTHTAGSDSRKALSLAQSQWKKQNTRTRPGAHTLLAAMPESYATSILATSPTRPCRSDSILLAAQFNFFILTSLKLTMEDSKFKGGRVNFTNLGVYGLKLRR